MEDSLSSCTQKRPEKEEESGWTAYLDDFSIISTQQEDYSSCYSSATSIVSDDASTAAWKLLANDQDSVAPAILKKLRLKKTRTKEISRDDSLEDTASSPLNTPKVSDAKIADNHHKMNLKTQQDRLNISLVNDAKPADRSRGNGYRSNNV